MRKTRKVLLFLFSGLWFMSGCGVVYTAVDVEPGVSSGINVSLVEMTPLSVEEANSAPYEPPRLPSSFDKDPKAMTRDVILTSIPETHLPESTGPAPYLIGPGDLLSLHADQGGVVPDQVFPVRDDGSVDLPRAGALPVQGLTVEQANSALSALLEEKRLDPVLTLEVREFRARFVLVDGDVEAPGRVVLDMRPLTLDEVIVTRGGSVAGQTGSVAHLFRNGEIYTIPLSDRTATASLHLRHGDRVHVSGAYDVDRVEAWAMDGLRALRLRDDRHETALASVRSRFELERSRLEAERGRFEARAALDAVDRPAVFIAGEVRSPRRVPLPFGRVARLADVLFDEGGVPLRTGNYAAIYVLRLGPDPSFVTAYELDASNAAHLLMATRFQMRPDDLIFVSEQKVTRINRILSQLTPVLATAGSGITSAQGG